MCARRRWCIDWTRFFSPARSVGLGRGRQAERARRRQASPGLLALEPRLAFAIAPVLVADVNTVPLGSAPALNATYSASAIGATDAGLLFQASDYSVGRGLWVTDGTADGTKRVSGHSNAEILATSPPFAGARFAMVQNFVTGTCELWKSDGTAAGTALVANFAPGDATSCNFEIFDDRLYFAIERGVWVTDGTTAGTSVVPGFGNRASYELFVLGDSLYALGSGGFSMGLYAKAKAGDATLVTTITDSFRTAYSAVVGSRFVFPAWGGSDFVLFATDGTAAGTGPLVGDGGPWAPMDFTVHEGVAYFSADSLATGRELWRTDGTAAGTRLVKDIAAGPASSRPGSLAVAAGKLFFAATTESSGRELWATDGTAAGTTLVKDIAPGSGVNGPSSSSPFSLVPALGGLFFWAFDNQLWKSDGTAAGTSLVRDFEPQAAAAEGVPAFGGMAEFAGRVFFPIDDGVVGRELWSSDGTAAGTTLFKDIVPGNGDGILPAWDPYVSVAAVGGGLVFQGDSPSVGTELFTLDGTGGVALVKDIDTWTGSYPSEFTAAGGRVYFSAFVEGRRQVWKTDGTADGTVRVGTVASDAPFLFTPFDGAVVFQAADETGNPGIYRTDGTDAGTVRVTADSITASHFTVCGGKLYFIDGTGPDATIRVMATPTSQPARAEFDDGALFHGPGALAAVGERLYVIAADPATAMQRLYATDGTAAGTVAIAGAGGATPDVDGMSLTPTPDGLFFTATMPETGRELWRTRSLDGVETAVLVRDMAEGPADSTFVGGLVDGGGRVYFLLGSGSLTEPGPNVLWESDGTADGTRASTIVGAAAPKLHQLSRVAEGTIYAVASDVAHGRELWALNAAPPAPPSALQATPGAASVALSWTTPTTTGGLPLSDYVVEYRRASAASWSTFADAVSSATSATVTGLVGGANYLFRVRARNAAGDGGHSATIAATVLTPPGAPQGLGAVPGAGRAVVSWTAPQSLGSRPIDDYVVQFRRARDAAWSTFADGVSAATSATVTGLTGGANYVFRVIARSAAGDGAPSLHAVATLPKPPSPPRWEAVAAGNQGSAFLAWSAPASQGDAPVSDYVVEFRRLAGSAWSTFDDGVSTTRSTTVTGLARGANYAFRIIARSAAGESVASGLRALTIG